MTDSGYLHDGMTSWMAGWKRRNWKTASGDPGAAPRPSRRVPCRVDVLVRTERAIAYRHSAPEATRELATTSWETSNRRIWT